MNRRTIAYAIIFVLVVTTIGAATHLSNSVTTSGEVPFSASNGPTAAVTGGVDVNATVFTKDNETVWLRTSGGNVTVSGNGPGYVRLDDIEGQYTNTSAIDTTSTAMVINPDDKSKIGVAGNVTQLDWNRTISTDDQEVDVAYAATSDGGTIDIYGLPESTKIALFTTGDSYVDTATTTSNGVGSYSVSATQDGELHTNSGSPSVDDSTAAPNATIVRYENQTLSVDVSDPDMPEEELSVEFYVDGTLHETKTVTASGTTSSTVEFLAEGKHDWHVEVTDVYGNTVTSTTYSFTVDHYDTVQSEASPTGDLTQEPTELSAQLNDTDFAYDGDELTAYFYLDGSQVGKTTLSSNGTAATSISSPDGGDHSWKLAVEDEYGQWSNETYSFSVPDTLYIYNETAPGTLIKNEGTVEVTFFTSGDVIKRTTSNGKVNLTGLPVGERIIVSANLKNYHDRRIIFESLYQQQEIYLLNTSIATSDITYELDDRSGQYPPESTILRIEKPLTKDFDGDGDTETKYRTIVSDEFDATNKLTATLDKGDRYRLEVQNSQNSVRDVGHYNVKGTASEVITIGRVKIPIDGDKGYAATAKQDKQDGTRYARLAYSDPEESTTRIEWNLTLRKNGTVVANGTETLTYGTWSTAIDISKYSEGTSMIAHYRIVRNGENKTEQRYIGQVPSIFGPIDIDPRWLELIGFVGIVAITGLVVIVDGGLGAVTAVITATLFTILGLVAIPTPVLGVGAVISIIYNVGRAR